MLVCIQLMVMDGLGYGDTYAVLRLRGNGVVAFAGVLNRDPLLAVHGFARDQVGCGKQIFLSTTSYEDTFVTMGLDDDLLAALCATLGAAPATTTRTRALLAKPNNQRAEGRHTLPGHHGHHVRHEQGHHGRRQIL